MRWRVPSAVRYLSYGAALCLFVVAACSVGVWVDGEGLGEWGRAWGIRGLKLLGLSDAGCCCFCQETRGRAAHKKHPPKHKTRGRQGSCLPLLVTGRGVVLICKCSGTWAAPHMDELPPSFSSVLRRHRCRASPSKRGRRSRISKTHAPVDNYNKVEASHEGVSL